MDAFYQSPPSYDAIREKICQIKREFPFVRNFSVGSSLLGRGLFALSLGNVHNACFVCGAVHGMEWLTSLVCLRFFEEVAKAYREKQCIAGLDVHKAIAARGLVVVPCVNPDGVMLSLYGPETAGALRDKVLRIAPDGDTARWQANARGVDLNHNFNAGFTALKEMERRAGITRPAMTRYGGDYPGSEPESRALVQFCEAYRPENAVALHSQGEEIYYDYGPCTPVRSALIARLMAEAGGYQVLEPEGLASHGGFKDWFIDKLHRPGFTIEIGKGENPLPASDFPEVYPRVRDMLMVPLVL